MLAEAIAITKPQLKKIGAAMAAAGNQEFAQLAPFILRLVDTPSSPTSHTTLRFNRVDALDDADSRFHLDIVPSTRGGTALKRARMQSDILIWTKLSEAYWESKGRRGYFMRTGSLLHDLAVELSDAPQTVGPIRVVFMDEKFTGQKKIKTKELLGFFRLTYVKSKFFHSSIIPALNPDNSPTTVDPKFQLEKLLFGTLTATRLGAYAGDASKGSGKFQPRHLVQPALAWFLTERIPAAMARAADRFLRGI